MQVRCRGADTHSRGTEVQRCCRDAELQRYRDAEVQRFRGAVRQELLSRC